MIFFCNFGFPKTSRQNLKKEGKQKRIKKRNKEKMEGKGADPKTRQKRAKCGLKNKAKKGKRAGTKTRQKKAKEQTQK